MTTIENINTGSTGSLGLTRRSYDRWYLNYPYGAIEAVDVLVRLGKMGTSAIGRGRGGATRCVSRMLVAESTLHDALASSAIAPFIEAAVPTEFISPGRGDRIWMMLGGINNAGRRSLYPVGDMIEQVDAARRRPHIYPADRIAQLRADGFAFISGFSKGRVSEILSLWKDSFEWDQSGVRKLEGDIDANKSRRHSDRSVWFSGIVAPQTKKIVAVATAERLDMPLSEAQSVPVVETTEWRCSDGVDRHGLAAAAVTHLNGQIVDDLRSLRPLIVAETNFISGAHHVGFAAGMDVPPRRVDGKFLSQMLVQNVRVGDGHIPDGLRDFTLMHLPTENIQTFYDTASAELMLKGDL